MMFLRLLAITLVAAVFLVPVNTLAVEQSNDSQLSTDQRLTNAVNDQHLTLDDATKALLNQKCQVAQVNLQKLQEKTDTIVESRINTYTTFQKEQQAIKLRMARQGVDASEIDLLIGKLQQGIDDLTLTANNYGTTLRDVITVDCIQKPEQFQAGLVVLRSRQSQLLQSANNLKKIMNDANTSTFLQLKKRLTA